jgi:hypothetical protein
MFYDNAPIYDYERRGAQESVAVLVCENCRESCERLTHVPEWDYMGCDDCMEEAMIVLAREACEHTNVHCELFEDVNEEAGRVYRHEVIECRDCGASLDSEGLPIQRRKKSTRRAA